MQHLRRNFLALFAALGLIAAALSGCGTDTAQNEYSTEASTETSVPDEEGDPAASSSGEQTREADADSSGDAAADAGSGNSEETVYADSDSFTYDSVPEYDGDPYVVVNDNEPDFSEDLIEEADESFIELEELDELGRTQAAVASLSTDTLATEERGSIGMIRPSGWQTVKYDCVAGKYAYNRTHQLGYFISSVLDDERNLCTGTRYMNLEMLEHEYQIDDYIEDTGNHVLYRVTPVFNEDELVCRGLHLEAMSVEDDGEGLLFNVYYYNVQPGIEIDYATGDTTYTGEFLDTDSEAVNYDAVEDGSSDTDTSGSSDSSSSEDSTNVSTYASSGDDDADSYDVPDDCTYVLNTNSMLFHDPDCGNAAKISESNRIFSTESRSEIIAEGYTPAGCCNP